MSCPAANSIVRMDVTMGSLPEGFCPATLKELAEAIAARLIVTPNQANSSFASGPIEPSSNQGPWFKNCEELFVFNDATASYQPITKSGFNNNEVFEASGTFTVPDNIFFLMVEVWGAGGGGADTAGSINNGGGGAGGYGLQFFSVTPSQSIPVVVGSGGAGGVSGSPGGPSSFLTLSSGGGTGATTSGIAGFSDPGIGGAVTGAKIGITGGRGEPGASNVQMGIGGSSPNGGGGGSQTIAATSMNGIQPGGGGAGGISATLGAGLPGSGGAGAAGRVVVWY